MEDRRALKHTQCGPRDLRTLSKVPLGSQKRRRVKKLSRALETCVFGRCNTCSCCDSWFALFSSLGFVSSTRFGRWRVQTHSSARPAAFPPQDSRSSQGPSTSLHLLFFFSPKTNELFQVEVCIDCPEKARGGRRAWRALFLLESRAESRARARAPGFFSFEDALLGRKPSLARLRARRGETWSSTRFSRTTRRRARLRARFRTSLFSNSFCLFELCHESAYGFLLVLAISARSFAGSPRAVRAFFAHGPRARGPLVDRYSDTLERGSRPVVSATLQAARGCLVASTSGTPRVLRNRRGRERVRSSASKQ